jgi:autotransporter-associated beta strand protein
MNGTGMLNIGDGAAAGIIDPATVYIAMSGASSTINFNHNEANYVFGTAINDVAGQTPASGSVNFIGTGTTTLTAVSNYTSATNVNAGKLVIASGASIADSILTTVNSGGTLSGAGGVGNVNVASGGTIAQSAGNTLTVKDITFAAGSTYQVGVTPNGQTGSIAANSATLNGGTVQVLAGSGNYAPGTSFTILSATAGVTGQFADAVNTNFAFLSAGLDYVDPNNVNLAITRNSTSFASVAQTQNQRNCNGRRRPARWQYRVRRGRSARHRWSSYGVRCIVRRSARQCTRRADQHLADRRRYNQQPPGVGLWRRSTPGCAYDKGDWLRCGRFCIAELCRYQQNAGGQVAMDGAKPGRSAASVRHLFALG